MTDPKQPAPAATVATKEATAKELSDFEKLLLKDAKTRIEYKPFQTETPIAISVKMVRDYIAVPAKDNDGKELWPDDRQCIRFIMLCLARKLNPYEGDAFMIPFYNKNAGRHDWSLITAHNAFLKRAEMHPDYDGKRSGIIIAPGLPCPPCQNTGVLNGQLCPLCNGQGVLDEIEGDYLPEGAKLAGGWCKVHYKAKKHPEHQRLKLSTYAKGFGNWTFDGAGMICKCAEAASLRSAFPNTMGGMYLREEMGLRDDADAALQEPAFSRPIFTKSGNGNPAPQEPAKPQELPPQSTPVKPEAPQTGPDTPKSATSQILTKATALSEVRKLCKTGKVKETELLGFLIEIGSAEQGTESLEELALQNEAVMGMVQDQWADISNRILEARNVPE